MDCDDTSWQLGFFHGGDSTSLSISVGVLAARSDADCDNNDTAIVKIGV